MTNHKGVTLEKGKWYWIDYSNYRGPAKFYKSYEHCEPAYGVFDPYACGTLGLDLESRDVHEMIETPDIKELMRRFVANPTPNLISAMQVWCEFALTHKMTRKQHKELCELAMPESET
ncbi:MAG: hypothetical protein WCY09_09825 [Candidatus Omnitrophota bacterium]